jgi:hypothetical protein
MMLTLPELEMLKVNTPHKFGLMALVDTVLQGELKSRALLKMMRTEFRVTHRIFEKRLCVE